MQPTAFAERIHENPDVYYLPLPTTRREWPLVAILCKNEKVEPFPSAASLLSHTCGVNGIDRDHRKEWDQDEADGSDNATDTDRMISKMLRAADDNDWSLWNFDVCTIPEGKFNGLIAVAIGSNTVKRKRAGSLALSIAAACSSNEYVATDLCNEFDSLARSLHTNLLDKIHRTAQKTFVAPHPYRGDESFSASIPSKPTYIPSFSSHITASAFHKCPKGHNMIPFRTQDSNYSCDCCNKSQCCRSCMHRCRVCDYNLCFACTDGSQKPVVNLPSAPRNRCTRPTAVDRVQHTYPVSQQTRPVAVPRAPVQTCARPHEVHQSQSTYPVGSQVREPSVSSEDSEVISSEWLGPVQELREVQFAAEVNQSENADKTEPIKSPAGFKYRVLDAENIGYEYGDRVRQSKKRFCIEGVKKAIEYFQAKDLELIVIGKHRELRSELDAMRKKRHFQVSVVGPTDDVFILKTAFRYGCPYVSLDNFRKEMEDSRISEDVREWCADCGKRLQVRFMFDENGEFEADYDH